MLYEFTDSDYVWLNFMQAEYELFLKEVDSKKSHGQIIRRMIKQGDSMETAESFYQLLISNISHYRKQNIFYKSELRRLEEQRERKKREQDAEHSASLAKYQNEEQTRKMMHFAGHCAQHVGIHLAKKLLGAIFGIPT